MNYVERILREGLNTLTAQTEYSGHSDKHLSHLNFSLEDSEEKHQGWGDFAPLPWTQPPDNDRLVGVGKHPHFAESRFNGILDYNYQNKLRDRLLLINCSNERSVLAFQCPRSIRPLSAVEFPYK
jgi:hypothetical protein